MYTKKIVIHCYANLKKIGMVRIMICAPKEMGQGLVEYALLLVMVVIVVFVVLMLLGSGIGGVFSTVNNSLSAIS